MYSEAEVGGLTDLDGEGSLWPTSIIFNLDALVRDFPDASRTSRANRFPDAHIDGRRRALGKPTDLLRLAFDGALPNAPEGETSVPREHSRPQQTLQSWLFARCDRLGNAGGLRQECVKRLAAAAAAMEQVKLQQAVKSSSRVVVEASKLQVEAVVALGLGKRSVYLPDSELSAADDVSQATAAANDDEALQRLLAKPEVAAAMEAIASDPSLINQFSKSPDVMDALQRLNAKLQG